MKTKVISILVLTMFILGPATSQAANIINAPEEANTQLQLKEQIAILWQEVARLMAMLVAIQETQNQIVIVEEEEEARPRDPRYIPLTKDEETETEESAPTFTPQAPANYRVNPDYNPSTCQFIRESRRGFATNVPLENQYCQEYLPAITPTTSPTNYCSRGGFCVPATSA